MLLFSVTDGVSHITNEKEPTGVIWCMVTLGIKVVLERENRQFCVLSEDIRLVCIGEEINIPCLGGVTSVQEDKQKKVPPPFTGKCETR